ncbi:siderophore-interacting protein [uncultured Nitratireductor sp.]|uniref:siderophore-interacting protein n=1 Tax=uncultured Nitratireductor sp. TaxID=520953 RepID=UPI0025DBF8FC|nr:siderophore-interacting protein [uncultured Nitratireductor sp.]
MSGNTSIQTLPKSIDQRPMTSVLPDKIHLVTVVAKERVTPHMLRVKFACANVEPFIGGEMHVRLLLPRHGRLPVWPEAAEGGGFKWPKGENEIRLRAYTIRAVDAERNELWIDFLLHPTSGVATPGADFARAARRGDRIALLGPGSGRLPPSSVIHFVADETALPAIARIAAEVPAGTRMRGIIEVFDEAEEQPLPTAGSLEVRWLHRRYYPEGAKGRLAREGCKLIENADETSFIWVACEKQDVRSMRNLLKTLGRNGEDTYVAWYWDRNLSPVDGL